MANFLGLDKGYRASGVILKYHGVVLTADDQVAQNTVLGNTTGNTFHGVSQELIDATDLSAGKRIINIRLQGISKAVANVAIARGTFIAVAANGKFLPAIATYHVAGIAHNTVTTLNDHFDLEIVKGGIF